ncbi:type II toxin-antitoxin system RelE/ParE family toxin [Mesorhizobium sp. M0622]|uniref:type II toxin-antitoxin system RelE/ParE family toxin n=1 Tax=unclassified Mesorhizobium TaxID=325217 RepID=UPI0033351DB9
MNLLPIIRTANAEEDLIAIWIHVAQDNEAAADRLLDRIEARWQQVATYPFSGAPREDIATGIRHLIVGEYLTLYRVSEEAIEIVRVLHGRRKIEAGDLSS